MTKVIAKKSIANKDILDLVVRILVDVENSRSNLMNLKEGPIILIDGLSRLLALITEGQNEENRYKIIISIFEISIKSTSHLIAALASSKRLTLRFSSLSSLVYIIPTVLLSLVWNIPR